MLYNHNLPIIKKAVERIKENLNIIFVETLEKYVFLNLTADELYKSFSNYEFKCKDEFYYVSSIILWITHNIEDRITYAEHLFSTINYKYCSRFLLLENSVINTGNSILDDIIKQVYIKIYILNDTSIKFFKDINIKSLNLNLDEKCIETESKLTLSNTNILTLCYVTSSGICNARTNSVLFKYIFGNVYKIIYDKSLLFIFSYKKLYKFDTLKYVISECCYPPTIEFKHDW